LTDVKTFDFPSSVFNTVDATTDATTTDSAIVDATVTAPYLTPSLVDLSRFSDVPMLNMLPHVIAEGMAPNIRVIIHSVEIHMLLDGGAQVSVLPSALAAVFDPPISLPSVTREVRTFGNHQVTLRGPLTLELQLCGFRTRHPFYFIDAATPAIGGYDLMQAARLVVDVANRRVCSRRPESATKGPIGPNPDFPVSNNSVHSSVAMTEPQHAHRVVVSNAMASSLEDLDIKASPTSLCPFGNSMSSSQATLEQPSAHSGLVPVQRSRPQPLGCGIPATNTLRTLAGRPAGSAPGDTGQVKKASKTFGVLAPRKRRRTVSDDLLTLPQELSGSATFTGRRRACLYGPDTAAFLCRCHSLGK